VAIEENHSNKENTANALACDEPADIWRGRLGYQAMAYQRSQSTHSAELAAIETEK